MAGTLDAVQNGIVYGWAFDAGAPAPASVDILVDGIAAANGIANIHRADLEIAGINQGNAGFQVPLPLRVLDSGFHVVEVIDHVSGNALSGSPMTTRLMAHPTPHDYIDVVPWTDAPDKEFAGHLRELRKQSMISEHEAGMLRDFREDGFMCLPQAVPHRVIDRVLADVEQAWKTTPRLLVVSPSFPRPVDIGEIAQVPGFRGTSYRYLDFHNVSEAAADIMCAPQVLRFVNLYFDESIASMQTLLFENGTQQLAHQDFPYVHSLRPAFLAGVWVALEDANEDAGPLFYYPKSHRLVDKFRFDDGSILAQGDGPHVRRYERYLESECQRLKLERTIFLPKKGDALVWHSALVHGGTRRTNLAKTRKSLVSHYTPRTAYPFDRRNPNQPPIVLERNGCMYYGWQADGHAESRFAL